MSQRTMPPPTKSQINREIRWLKAEQKKWQRVGDAVHLTLVLRTLEWTQGKFDITPSEQIQTSLTMQQAAREARREFSRKKK